MQVAGEATFDKAFGLSENVKQRKIPDDYRLEDLIIAAPTNL
jgi:hypothetical protein